jgi:hypothetical protein
LLLIGLGSGCRPSPQPVDLSKAKQSLVAALDAWKRGDKPETLKPIVVQDFDWMNGAKLVTYEMAGEAKEDTLNLRCPVTLKLVGADGKEAELTVTYIVGTSPVTTVFREFSM